ncbi:MAG: type VI secretion system protein IglI family protein [Myxococcota bacterium]
MNAPIQLPTDLLDGPRPMATRVDGEIRSTIRQLEQLADRGNYREAAEKAAELLRSHVYDLRLACVYQMGLFAERGIGHLPPLLASMARLVTDEGRAPPHVRTPTRTIDTALTWLLQTLFTQIRFHAKRKDEVWSSWLTAESELPAQIAEGLDALRESAEGVLGSVACAGILAKTRRWALKDLARALSLHQAAQAKAEQAAAEQAAAEQAAAEQAAAERANADSVDPHSTDAAMPESAPPPSYEPDDHLLEDYAYPTVTPQYDEAPPHAPGPYPTQSVHDHAPLWASDPGCESTSLPSAHDGFPTSPGPSDPPATELGSPALASLRDKLYGFELLVRRGQFARAAIVAHDVQRLIEDFDPVTYLPSLFAGYFRTMSHHLEHLRPHLEQGDTTHWQALSRFYQADLAGFCSDD